jgi:hypothetical protein
MLLSFLGRRRAREPKRVASVRRSRLSLEALDDRINPTSPHFIGDASAVVDAAGTLTVSWKEAGLGNNQNIDYTMAAVATGQFQWFNHGGNKPQGQPFQFGPETLSASGTFNSGQNGNITASLSIAAPAPSQEVVDAGTSSNWVLQETVNYSDITLTDTTNGVDATVSPSSLGPVTFVVPT